MFAISFGAERAELQIAPRRILEALALEGIQLAHDPLVDALAEEEHFDAALLELLDIRARPCRRDGIGDDVIDALLSWLHPLNILTQGDYGLVLGVVGAGEAQ